MATNLLDPTFIAGKALFLRRLTHSWEAARVEADRFAAATKHKQAKPMWQAVAAHIRAHHSED